MYGNEFNVVSIVDFGGNFFSIELFWNQEQIKVKLKSCIFNFGKYRFLLLNIIYSFKIANNQDFVKFECYPDKMAPPSQILLQFLQFVQDISILTPTELNKTMKYFKPNFKKMIIRFGMFCFYRKNRKFFENWTKFYEKNLLKERKNTKKEIQSPPPLLTTSFLKLPKYLLAYLLSFIPVEKVGILSRSSDKKKNKKNKKQKI